MNYWLCITTKKNHDVSLNENVLGVDERYKKKLDMIKKDDRIIYYIKGMKLGGAFKVISDLYNDTDKIFDGGLFPFRVKIEPIKIPTSKWLVKWTDEIIQNVEFINNKDYRWKFEFMGRAIINLSKKDFDYLLSKIQ